MLNRFFIIIILSTAAQIQAEPLTSGFTYQGKLQSNNTPANGFFDFEFALHDAETDNAQIGSNVFVEDVVVIDGVFSVALDFGTEPYAGDQLWLDISVRNGSETGGYTGLLPRQKITATPYALHAEMVAMDAIGSGEIADNSLTSADIATDAVSSAELAPGAVRTSDVNAAEIQLRVNGNCTAGSAIQTVNQDGSVTCIAAIDGEDGQPGPPGADGDDLFSRTLVVRSGGTATENGNAYIAALNSVSASSPSASNPWAIHLEPGDYFLSSTPPSVPGNVRLRGAGIDVTTLRCGSCTILASTGAISVTDLTLRSDTSLATAQVATARLERVIIENTHPLGDSLEVNDGDLTLIDSTLRTRPTAESGVSQRALLATDVNLDIQDSVMEGFRPRVTLNDTAGSIRGSSFRSIFVSTGNNQLDISHTKIDASPTLLSGGSLIAFGSSTSSVNVFNLNNVEMIGAGSLTGVSVGENTIMHVAFSTLLEGRFIGAGAVHLRHVTVDEPVSVTTETCFAVVRLDNASFNATTCP
ncbi:MAG: hypothetical protein AB8B96_09525 [Lysobacterales bacterium]